MNREIHDKDWEITRLRQILDAVDEASIRLQEFSLYQEYTKYLSSICSALRDVHVALVCSLVSARHDLIKLVNEKDEVK